MKDSQFYRPKLAETDRERGPSGIPELLSRAETARGWVYLND